MSVVKSRYVQATLTDDYKDDLSIANKTIEFDASKNVMHLDLQLTELLKHTIVVFRIRNGAVLLVIVPTDDGFVTRLAVQEMTISIFKKSK